MTKPDSTKKAMTDSRPSSVQCSEPGILTSLNMRICISTTASAARKRTRSRYTENGWLRGVGVVRIVLIIKQNVDCTIFGRGAIPRKNFKIFCSEP
jgi:hypothetical protein